MCTTIKKPMFFSWLRWAVIMPITFSLVSVTFAHELGLQLYSVRKQMEQDLPSAFNQINQWGI
jgi:hypothetical protein